MKTPMSTPNEKGLPAVLPYKKKMANTQLQNPWTTPISSSRPRINSIVKPEITSTQETHFLAELETAQAQAMATLKITTHESDFPLKEIKGIQKLFNIKFITIRPYMSIFWYLLTKKPLEFLIWCTFVFNFIRISII